MENHNFVTNLESDTFKTVALKLDTTTILQNQYFEEDDSLFFGYKRELTWVSFGEKQLGYVVFTKDKELFASLVEWKEGFKVIGIAKLPSLKEKEELVECRYTIEHQCDLLTFGVIEVVENDIVKTIRAWQINDNEKSIEQINPSTVDFTESYNTDAD